MTQYVEPLLRKAIGRHADQSPASPGRPFRLLRNALLIFTLLAWLVLLIITGYNSYMSYLSRMQQAEQETQSAARLLQEHADRTLETVELIIRQIAKEEGSDLSGEGQSGDYLYLTLRTFKEASPALESIVILDRRGMLKASSAEWKPEPRDLSAQPYFLIHQIAPNAGTYLGAPVAIKADNSHSIQMSRRIDDLNGNFIGVVMATISPDYYETFYRTLDLGENGIVALTLKYGKVLVSVPSSSATNISYFGKSLLSEPFFSGHTPDTLGMTVQTPSGLDGVERVISYRKGKQPIIVEAGVASDTILRDWLNSQILLFCLVFAAGGVMILFAVNLTNQLKKQEETESALREQRNLLHNIINATPDLIFLKDSRLIYRSVNPAFCQFLKKNESEIIGREDSALYPAEMASRYREDELAVVQKGQIIIHDEEYTRPGDSTWLQMIKTPVYDTAGTISGLVCSMRDISQHKKAQQALWESEERYRTLVENQGEGVILLDTDERVTFANPAAGVIFGLPVKELLNRQIFEFLEPQDRQIILAQSELRRMGTTSTYELSITRADGAKRIILVTASPYYDSKRELIGYFGVFRDTTEKYEAEEALRRSEQQFRLLAETIRQAFWLGDADTPLITYVSPAYEEIWGITSQELYDHPELWQKSIHPDDWERISQADQALMAGQFFDEEYRIIRPDGGIRWVWGHSFPIINEQGRITQLAGVAEDITSRKEAELALAEEKEMLSITLRSITDGVIAVDTAGLILLINPVAESLTGRREAEAVGQPLEAVMRLYDERKRQQRFDPLQLASKEGGLDFGDGQCILSSSNGSEYLISISGAPILDDAGRKLGSVLVFSDLTLRRRMEAEMEKASKIESIGLLAGGIAHDFNNLLTAIYGNISLAKISRGSIPADSDTLTAAENACLQARELTRQLLTFSRGGAPIKETTSVVAIVHDTANLILRGSNIRPEMHLPEDLWPIDADAAQIGQVIQNLLINAVQAMPNGGIIYIDGKNATEEEIKELPLKGKRYVRLTFTDQGIGIPPELLPKIFDPYFTTKAKGSGLGLATSYSIIKHHNGYIRVKSKEGVGTTFEIYLPASEKPLVKVPKKENTAEFKGSGRILAMDDDLKVLELVSNALTAFGYQVSLARNGEEALTLFTEAQEMGKPFDVVIVDLTVPGGMGGKETMRKLLEMDAGVKVIVSSGYSNDPIMANYREYGFAGIVAKPYSVTDLGEILQRIMQGKHVSQ